MGLDADLISYYEAEARGRHRVSVDELRLPLRRRFADLLRREGRARIVDVGAGPGLDTAAWYHDRFAVAGVDLAHGNAVLMRERGLIGVTGSLYELPFASAAFDGLWTMSTFVHVPDARVGDALAELVRVVSPGGPLAIGTWGGHDAEGVQEFGELRPYRFYSLRSHDRWRRMLAAHGVVETFDTIEPAEPGGWEYQFAVVRVPGSA